MAPRARRWLQSSTFRPSCMWVQRSKGHDHIVSHLHLHVQQYAVAAYLEAGVHPAEPFARNVCKVGADVAILDVELVRTRHHIVLFRDSAVKINKGARDHVQPAVRQPLRIVDLVVRRSTNDQY